MATITPSKSRRRVSQLHAKGILILCLLLIADQITVSKAIKFWSEAHQGLVHDSLKDRNYNFASKVTRSVNQVQECLASDATCTPSPSLPPIKRTLGRLTKRLGGAALDCCIDCSHCTLDAIKSCRGGSAEAAVDAASAVMPHGIPLNGWKVIFQAFLTTLNVLCWLIPLRNKKISENKLALSLANAFSGGVFLSLAFGHLIPECVHGFEGFNEVTPYLLVLFGYLLIFFVEKVAFDAHEIMHEMEHSQDKKKGQNGDNGMSSGRSAVILLGALAVHSILEMTALGLADTFGDSAILTLSIALHQVRDCDSESTRTLRFLRSNPVIIACGINCSSGCILEVRYAKGTNYSLLVGLQCYGTNWSCSWYGS